MLLEVEIIYLFLFLLQNLLGNGNYDDYYEEILFSI